MKKRIILAFLCATALMIDGSLIFAQERPRERRPSSATSSSATFVSSEGGTIEIQAEGGHFAWAQQGAAERATFEFAISEMVMGKAVKGAPYSAEAVTESIQVLADGNRIVQRNVAAVSRDSEGRTRRDQTMKWRGGDGQSEERKTSFINDPVSGTSYTLHHNEKTAFKTWARKIQVGPADEEKAEALARDAEVKAKIEARGSEHMKMKPPHPQGPPGAIGFGGDIRIAMGGPGFAFSGKMDAKKESLGTQTIEGVQAEGIRVTMTIPAGEIGNEQPINIVSERWHSPELQVVVMTRHSDPRAGETTYRLTNINRSEPARSLFEVPSDYTLREGGPGGVMRRKREM
jgi:hypothetical protein